MGKSEVMVFSKDRVEGRWKWGKHELPKVSSYCYLGIDFAVMEHGMCILKR